MSVANNPPKPKAMQVLELEPLFDYSRATPSITLDDSDDDDVQIIDKFEVKSRRRASKPFISLHNNIQRAVVTNVEEKKVVPDDDWLTPPTDVRVNPVQPVDPHILLLRKRKVELLKLSVLLEAENAQLDAEAKRAKPDPSSIVSDAVDSPRGESTPRSRQKILLQLQERSGKIHQVKIFTDDKFEKLLTIFSEKIAKRPATEFSFRFDGSAIDLQKTPKEMELEEEDIIEIYSKTTQPNSRV